MVNLRLKYLVEDVDRHGNVRSVRHTAFAKQQRHVSPKQAQQNWKSGPSQVTKHQRK